MTFWTYATAVSARHDHQRQSSVMHAPVAIFAFRACSTTKPRTRCISKGLPPFAMKRSDVGAHLYLGDFCEIVHNKAFSLS